MKKASFDALGGVDKGERSLGRIVTFADTDDANLVLGHIYISYVPSESLRKPTDPALQLA